MAGTLFQDNLSPYLTIVEATEPSAPSAGQQRIYIDSTTHLLKATNSSGTDRTIEGLSNPLTTTGDIIYSSSGTTAARRAVGSTGDVLTVTGGVPVWAAPAAGGITRTQLGYTSIGASFDTTLKTVAKKITCATAGLIASISIAMKGDSTNTANITVFVMSDNSGTPLNIIAAGGAAPQRSSGTAMVSTTFINSTARFITFPVGIWVAAADYWICALVDGTSGNGAQICYDGSGSDFTSTATDAARDQSITTLATQTNKYSLYADFLK